VERLEKRGRKKDAQLRRLDRSHTLEHQILRSVFSSSAIELTKREAMALLPSLACSRCGLEWQVSDVLLGPASKRSVWRHKQRNGKRVLAKTGQSKKKSS